MVGKKGGENKNVCRIFGAVDAVAKAKELIGEILERHAKMSDQKAGKVSDPAATEGEGIEKDGDEPECQSADNNDDATGNSMAGGDAGNSVSFELVGRASHVDSLLRFDQAGRKLPLKRRVRQKTQMVLQIMGEPFLFQIRLSLCRCLPTPTSMLLGLCCMISWDQAPSDASDWQGIEPATTSSPGW